MFRNWIRWASLFLSWLAEPRVFVALVLIPLAIGALIFLGISCLERDLRLTGMCLQLAGFVIVAAGLNSARKQFGKPGLWTWFVGWLGRRPKIRPHSAAVSGQVIQTLTILSSGQGRTGPPPGLNIEERLKRLENEQLKIWSDVDQFGNNLKAEVNKFREELSLESEQRKSADRDLAQQLDEAVGAGVYLQIMGVIYFALGVLLATASPEIYLWASGSSSCPAAASIWRSWLG